MIACAFGIGVGPTMSAHYHPSRDIPLKQRPEPVPGDK
ncbi:hypothetical protein ABIE65_003690 [Constrictibacter sp. MBR-5]|jgi:hypothetical protein